uniref:Saposin B-type domain-containing protein n=1 Tax=Cuerna arida TaxID=1464854 RepID=A0A1B6GZ43_9HEMI
MEKLLSLLCLVVILASISITTCLKTVYYPKHCSGGSEIICMNLATAKSCNATKMCIDYWSKNTISVDESVCETCMNMIRDARETLESDDTKEIIDTVMNATCNIYFKYVPSMRRKCDEISIEYMDEFIQMLSSNMDEKTICTVVFLCRKNVAEISNCERCHNFAKNQLQRLPSEPLDFAKFVSRFAHKFCAISMNNDQLTCRTFMIRHTSEIHSYLLLNLQQKNLCLYSSQCPLDGDAIISNSLIEIDSKNDTCDMCKVITTNIRNMLVFNTTFEQFKRISESICMKLFDNSKMCETDVDEYYKYLFDFLEQKDVADMICVLMNLCDSNVKWEDLGALLGPYNRYKVDNILVIGTDDEVPIFKPWKESQSETVKPKKKIDFGDTIDDFEPIPFDRRSIISPYYKAVQESSTSCDYCSQVVSFISKWVHYGLNESQIRVELQQFCNLLHIDSTKCLDYMKNVHDIIVMINDNITPEVICQKLCSNPDYDYDSDSNSDSGSDSETEMASTDCDICRLVVNLLKNKLHKNETESKIKTYLEHICDEGTTKFKSQCTEFVDKYSDEAIKKFLSGLDSKKVCLELRFCDKKPKSTEEKKVSKICKMCNKISQIIYENKDRTPFNFSDSKQLKKICHNFDNEDECEDLAKAFGPTLNHLILQMDRSQAEACDKVGLCTN